MPSDSNCDNCKLCRLNNLLLIKGFPTNTLTQLVNNGLEQARSYDPLSNMSSPSPDSMARKAALERTLRVISIWAWLPAFPLLLSHGITSRFVLPVLGIIPMTFTAVVGLAMVLTKPKTRLLNMLLDLFLAIFHIAILIPSWITIAEHHWWDAGDTMLATYGTVPLMLNFCIHTYLSLRDIFPLYIMPAIVCPHCHGDLLRSHAEQHGSSYHQVRRGSSDSKDSYNPVTMVDAEAERGRIGPEMIKSPASGQAEPETLPRESTDDETARLV